MKKWKLYSSKDKNNKYIHAIGFFKIFEEAEKKRQEEIDFDKKCLYSDIKYFISVVDVDDKTCEIIDKLKEALDVVEDCQDLDNVIARKKAKELLLSVIKKIDDSNI